PQMTRQRSRSQDTSVGPAKELGDTCSAAASRRRPLARSSRTPSVSPACPGVPFDQTIRQLPSVHAAAAGAASVLVAEGRIPAASATLPVVVLTRKPRTRPLSEVTIKQSAPEHDASVGYPPIVESRAPPGARSWPVDSWTSVP